MGLFVVQILKQLGDLNLLAVNFVSLEDLEGPLLCLKTNAANVYQVEEHYETYPHQRHNLKCTVRSRERGQQCSDLPTLRLAILNEGQDILQKLNFTHAKHDAESHSQAESRFLLIGCNTSLNKRENNVKADCEGQPPIKFEILRNLLELELTSVSGVFIPAVGLLQTVKSLFYLLKQFEVCFLIVFWI